MNFSLSVPGKTFLCGEYVALHGGPCVLLATQPRFRLNVTKGPGKAPAFFHPDSPAGRFYKKRENDFSGWQMDFENPYGAGGFGASTAQFLLLKAFAELRDTLQTEAQLDLDLKSTLSDFRDLHSDETVKPSGADLIAQACGQVTAFERRSGRIQVFSWPFPHLSWAIFSTGRKLASHEHLKNLKLDSSENMVAPVHQVWEALRQVSEGSFIVGLNDFARALANSGLQDKQTLEQVQQLRSLPGVRAAKGCGAMGADTLFVLFDRREIKAADVLAHGTKLGLEYRVSEADLSPGLQKDFVRNEEALR